MKRPGLGRALRTLVGGALFGFVGVALSASDFDVLDINEGELRFLTEVPAKLPHLQSTHVIVNEESLETGWLRVTQRRRARCWQVTGRCLQGRRSPSGDMTGT